MNRIVVALSIVLLLAASGVACGMEYETTERPPPTPFSESRMNRDGFDGMLLVTPDKDWQEKWNTPPEIAPSYTTTDEVKDGGELWVLPFFSNPQLDEHGNANVTCDLEVTRPDGSVSQTHKNQPCYQGPMRADPRRVYLANSAIGFIAEPTDPRGKWIVRITLRDNLRGVELPLQTSFVLK